MNFIESGKLISKLRKEAGYTQASLAQALNVTDKAISKWERGIGLPDVSLLPKISKLLDCDMEILISGLSEYKDHTWSGLLIVEDGGASISTKIFDKPMIYYLLSYFLLVGITNVSIKINPKKYSYIRKLKLEQYGFKISFIQNVQKNLMIIHGKTLLFGANLTRVFQSYMSVEDIDIIPTIDDIELPIIFSHNNFYEKNIKKNAERRAMTRGMVNLPLNNAKEVKDASEFVRIYQTYHDIEIADLHEIALKRNTIINYII